jgi:hypothetical protein
MPTPQCFFARRPHFVQTFGIVTDKTAYLENWLKCARDCRKTPFMGDYPRMTAQYLPKAYAADSLREIPLSHSSGEHPEHAWGRDGSYPSRPVVADEPRSQPLR